MNRQATITEPVFEKTDFPSLLHLCDTCCGPAERTLCGLAIGSSSTEVSHASAAHDPCVVCFSLSDSPFGRCRNCGR